MMFTPVDSLNSEKKSEPVLESEPIVVVCSADDKYAMQLAVTGCSVLMNLKSDRKMLLYVIDGGIKNRNKQKVLKSLASEKCEVKFLPKPDSLLGDDIEEINKRLGPEGNTIAKYVSIATFFRLLIPELLPNQFDKAIYLDCDLVVNRDLEQLWQIDIGENYVLAAQDIWIPYVSKPNGLLNYQELGISPDSKYFNAGVLVINLKKWRSEKISAKAIEYLKQNREYVRWHDQDVLNALLAGQWGELDPRWNCSPSSIYSYSSWQESPFSEDVYNSLIGDPYIIHFMSAQKPWTSRHTPFKDYFFKYVDMTAWSGWRFTFRRRLWFWLVAKLREAMHKLF